MSLRYTFFLLISSFSFSIAFAQKPIPAFEADVTVGCAPFTVSFTDKSSDDVIAWQWDFNNDRVIDAVDDPYPIYTYTTPGYYSVKLVVANSTASDSITKTRFIRVTAPISAGVQNLTMCAGDTVTLRATISSGIRPFTYLWEAIDFPYISSDSTPRFSPDTTHIWRLTITDSVGCSTEKTFTILVSSAPEKPAIKRINNTLSCVAIGVNGFQWYLNGSRINGATNQSYVVDTSKVKSGYYHVQVTNSSGCKSQSDSVDVSTLLSISDLNDEFWSLYPNPVSNSLFISSNTITNVRSDITLTNALGEVVMQSTLEEGISKHLLNMNSLPSGFYILTIRNSESLRFFRLSKE